LEEAKHEQSKKRSRLHALEEMRSRREGIGAGAKALVDTKDSTLVGLLADRVEAPAELTAALAGLLGAHLEDVVVDDVGRGVELLADLAQSRRGRATIVPRHPAYIAGRTALVENETGVIGRLVDQLRYAAD